MWVVGMLQIPLLTMLGFAFSAATERGDDMALAMLARGCAAIRDLARSTSSSAAHDRQRDVPMRCRSQLAIESRVWALALRVSGPYVE